LNQGNGDFAAFSISKVFWRDEGFREAKRLAGLICPRIPVRGIGRRDGLSDFGDIKGLVEAVFGFLRICGQRWVPATDLPAFHPGKSAHIEIAGSRIGYLGALHPNTAETQGVDANCWIFEVDLGKVLEYCPARATFEELPRFPVVVRDVAIVTDIEFESDRVVDFIARWERADGLIEAVDLFDHYDGDAVPAGKKSLAYSVAYRAADRTLTDAEVNEVHTRLVTALRDSLGVALR
jgi:phenylalanyl-tRNA synthetase beta chain